MSDRYTKTELETIENAKWRVLDSIIQALRYNPKLSALLEGAGDEDIVLRIFTQENFHSEIDSWIGQVGLDNVLDDMGDE